MQVHFYLDMGDIQDAIDGSARKDLYDRYFNIMPGYEMDDVGVKDEDHPYGVILRKNRG